MIGMFGLPSKPSDTPKRRRLRRNAPRTERLLWPYLANRRLNGYKFRRQHSADRFVLDFYCPERGLAIEIDGPSHYSAKARAYDARRQRWIEGYGVTFQRFSNWEVYNRREGVLQAIEALLDALEDLQTRPGAAKYPRPKFCSWSTLSTNKICPLRPWELFS
jgi:very-short-patch-repair endonuclease